MARSLPTLRMGIRVMHYTGVDGRLPGLAEADDELLVTRVR
jgi:hypothetical protein